MATLLDTNILRGHTLKIDKFIDETQKLRRLIAENTTGGVCTAYLTGSCPNGNHCMFKHNRVPQTLICKHYLRGLCKKGEYCEFQHVYDLSRMPTCQFFLAFGECGNPDCPFLHVKSSESLGECEDYKNGFCERGPKCSATHTRREFCADYLTGFCELGPNCPNAHPKFEEDGGKERRRRAAMMRAAEMGETNITDDDIGRGFFTERVSYRQAHTAKPQQTMNSITCNRCGELGHFAAQCPSAGPADKHKIRKMEDVQCFRCGEKGHYANVCNGQRKPLPPGVAPPQQFNQRGPPMQQRR